MLRFRYEGERQEERAEVAISINALRRLYKYLYDDMGRGRVRDRMMGRQAGKAQDGWWEFFTKGGIVHEARA